MAKSGDTVVETRPWVLPLLVCVSAVVAYAALPGFQFVFDDQRQVLGNPTLLSVSSIPQYFLHHMWSYVPEALASYFRPLFSTWLNLNYALFGTHPGGWHIALLCLHVVASFLTYQLVCKVFENQSVGFLAALLFAVHPVHVESVAWVSGGPDPLAAVFGIGSFLLYRKAQGAEGSSKPLFVAMSLASYACALLTKEAVLLFPVLILLDLVLLTRKSRTAGAVLVSTLPYFLMSGAYCLIRVAVLGSFSQIKTPLTATALFYTLPSVLLFYLGLLLFPVGLSPFYDTPYVDKADLLHFWTPVLALILGAALMYACIRRLAANNDDRGIGKKCAFFVLWMAVFLVPALDLKVFDPGEIAHDRYLYLPSVGFCAVLAFLLQQAAVRLGLPRRTQAVAAAALVLWLGAATVAQSYYWRNDLVLYRRGASVAPLNVNAQNNLANVYLDSGDFDRGIALHQKILEKHPAYAESYYNIGMAYYNQRNFPLAQSYFQRAVSLRNSPDWYFYLGMAQFKSSQPAAAESSFREAVRRNPGRSDFHAALGAVYENEGKLALALEEFESAERIKPGNQAVGNEISRIKQQLRL